MSRSNFNAPPFARTDARFSQPQGSKYYYYHYIIIIILLLLYHYIINHYYYSYYKLSLLLVLFFIFFEGVYLENTISVIYPRIPPATSAALLLEPH